MVCIKLNHTLRIIHGSLSIEKKKKNNPGASSIRHGFSVSWETNPLVEHWTLGSLTVRQSSCPVNDHGVTKQKTLIILLKRVIKHLQHEANSPLIILHLFKNNGCLIKKKKRLIITLQTEQFSSHWFTKKIFIQILKTLVTVFTHIVLWVSHLKTVKKFPGKYQGLD